MIGCDNCREIEKSFVVVCWRLIVNPPIYIFLLFERGCRPYLLAILVNLEILKNVDRVIGLLSVSLHVFWKYVISFVAVLLLFPHRLWLPSVVILYRRHDGVVALTLPARSDFPRNRERPAESRC